jgi:hypothetical protein
VAKVGFDGLAGHEERLGDFTVGLAAGGEFGDPALAGSEGLEAGEHLSAGACARGGELLAGFGGEGCRAAAMREVQRRTEVLSCLTLCLLRRRIAPSSSSAWACSPRQPAGPSTWVASCRKAIPDVRFGRLVQRTP